MVWTAFWNSPSSYDMVERAGDAFTVVIPTLNEASRIADVVRESFAGGAAEVLVINGASTDATAEHATTAGAIVYPAAELFNGQPSLGKGDSLWRAVPLVKTPVTVFLDGDLQIDGPDFLTRLIAPLDDPDVVFSKARFRRTVTDGNPSKPGRVTNLVARPMLRLLYPNLADLVEPLSGQIATATSTINAIEFETDYGLEIGMLIDVYERYGREAIAHPDCGELGHLSQTDQNLEAMAEQVQRAVLQRTGRFEGFRAVRRPAWNANAV